MTLTVGFGGGNFRVADDPPGAFALTPPEGPLRDRNGRIYVKTTLRAAADYFESVRL